jgi:hypothetical protein
MLHLLTACPVHLNTPTQHDTQEPHETQHGTTDQNGKRNMGGGGSELGLTVGAEMPFAGVEIEHCVCVVSYEGAIFRSAAEREGKVKEKGKVCVPAVSPSRHSVTCTDDGASSARCQCPARVLWASSRADDCGVASRTGGRSTNLPNG